MDDKERLILIHYCRGSSWKVIQSFYLYDPSLKSIFSMSKEDFQKKFGMKEGNAQLFYEDLHNLTYKQLQHIYERHHIKVMTIYDQGYPDLLRNIFDPPWVLYYIGNEKLLQTKCLAVVGTRNPSQNGRKSMERLLPPIIQRGWTIVSGLAMGIDSFAHQLAIKQNGHTIAVLGSGLFHLYPPTNRPLAVLIAKKHLLLSEYPPYFPPKKWQFPVRNRIISGLSYGTVVIEAKEKSGSLITADQALEQGRDVFAVPGSILNEGSRGTNQLIQAGAKLVLEPMDILEEID